ncbi:hypothetical protein WP1_251 [Pseudomonas phage WP1]
MLMRTGENILDRERRPWDTAEYIFSPQKRPMMTLENPSLMRLLSSPDMTGIEQPDIDITGEVFGVDAKVITIHGPVTAGV